MMTLPFAREQCQYDKKANCFLFNNFLISYSWTKVNLHLCFCLSGRKSMSLTKHDKSLGVMISGEVR